jgi:hypothetical protein
MQLTCAPLYATYRRFWTQERLHDVLPSFFILMHQIVRASVPLMQCARSVATERASWDPVCREMVAYLAQHVEEERDHDEWVIEDLETVGLSREDVLGRIPAGNVASLVGAQYYWIQHHHPVALLGYIRLLEGGPPSQSHIDNLQRRSGLPAAMFRTYRLHGQLDPNHLGDLNLCLDSLPLSELHSHLLWVSATHTASELTRCLEQLERSNTATLVSGR